MKKSRTRQDCIRAKWAEVLFLLLVLLVFVAMGSVSSHAEEGESPTASSESLKKCRGVLYGVSEDGAVVTLQFVERDDNSIQSTVFDPAAAVMGSSGQPTLAASDGEIIDSVLLYGTPAQLLAELSENTLTHDKAFHLIGYMESLVGHINEKLTTLDEVLGPNPDYLLNVVNMITSLDMLANRAKFHDRGLWNSESVIIAVETLVEVTSEFLGIVRTHREGKFLDQIRRTQPLPLEFQELLEERMELLAARRSLNTWYRTEIMNSSGAQSEATVNKIRENMAGWELFLQGWVSFMEEARIGMNLLKHDPWEIVLELQKINGLLEAPEMQQMLRVHKLQFPGQHMQLERLQALFRIHSQAFLKPGDLSSLMGRPPQTFSVESSNDDSDPQ